VKNTPFILLLLFVLLSFVHSSAALKQFTASPNTDVATIDEQVTITATIISDKEIKNITGPSLPAAEFYTILRTGRNQQQSTSVQIINGKMTQSINISYIFTYTLALKKIGVFTVPGLLFSHEGKTYSTRPFNITVTKVGKQEVKVAVRADKKELFVSEQGILTVEILKTVNAPVELTNDGFVSAISHIEETFGKNFSINRLFRDKVSQSQKQIDGQVYQVFSLSFSIIPLNSGTYTLQSIPFQYHELKRSGSRRDPFSDFFGDSFFGGGINRTSKVAYSNKLNVTVNALPPSPADFSGAVGAFSLSAKVNEHTVSAGEAVTLSINLRGTTRPGNLKDITLSDMSDFEIFTPEKHTSVDTSAQGISTTKRYKYLVIPKEEGDKTIPSIQWVYFNPKLKEYKTLSTSPIQITVTKGKTGSKRQTRYLTQSDIQELGQDIRYIKTSTVLKNQSHVPYKNSLFFILYPLPFLIAVFAFLYRIQATILKKDPMLQLKKQAFQKAKKEASALKKSFLEKIPDNALSRIAEIIENYISHRFGFNASGKTLEELKEELVKRDIEQSVSDSIIPFFEKLDSYRFSGVTPDNTLCNELLDTSCRIIEGLESRGKKR